MDETLHTDMHDELFDQIIEEIMSQPVRDDGSDWGLISKAGMHKIIEFLALRDGKNYEEQYRDMKQSIEQGYKSPDSDLIRKTAALLCPEGGLPSPEDVLHLTMNLCLSRVLEEEESMEKEANE